MEDFGSAVMVRVLAEGMRLLALETGGEAPLVQPEGARLALEDKRAVVGRALALGGPAGLLALGRGVAALRGEPTYRLLTAARDPSDLIARWLRLERYVHSRHRIEVLEQQRSAIVLQHVSLRRDAPPLPAEDLVVAGVLAALLGEIGARDVEVELAGGCVFPRSDPDRLLAAWRDGATARWTLRWRETGPPPAGGTPGPAVAIEIPATWPPLAQRLAAIVLEDLGAVPALGDAAGRIGRSPRAVQRELATVGLTWSRLVAELRTRTAAGWLLHHDASVAEIGFLCGYADQPHFTRRFVHAVGLPPARYRAEFGASRDVALRR